MNLIDAALTDHDKEFRDYVASYARNRLNADDISASGFSFEALRKFADDGLVGLSLPESDGGHGASILHSILALDAISEVSPWHGDVFQAGNFGAINQISHFGHDDLKDRLLKPLLAGEFLVTAGMSEPDAGSSLSELKTNARRVEGEVVVNGQKTWNSHGPSATHSVVWCRFGSSQREIGAVVVPLNAKGVTRGSTRSYMSGEEFCELFFDDCALPIDHILVDNAGLSKMLPVFGIERLGSATRCVAFARYAFNYARDHASVRQTFGSKVRDFQGIQWKFAEMSSQLDAAQLLVYSAALSIADGVPDPYQVAKAKLFAAQISLWVANEAVQILGAAGYEDTSPVSYVLRKVRGWSIAGGSLEMMRNRVAEGVFGTRLPQQPRG
jgi:alkylation response protein AidB-like acyl-CoA dehydrogenase